MKIALVFCGQPRYINEILIFQLNQLFFLNKYDCDVYAHFWFKKDKDYVYNTGPDSHLYDFKIDENSINLFCQLYNPKGILVEDPPTLQELSSREYTKYNTEHLQILPTLSYTTSLKKAYSLIDNPDQYDFIIRLRTDLLIVRCPDLNMLPKENIYLFSVKLDEAYIYDCFFITPPKYAKILCHEIDNIDTMYDNGQRISSGELFLKNIEVNNLLQHCRLLPFSDFYFRVQRQGRTLHSMIGISDGPPE